MKRILAALDTTENSRFVFDGALELAKVTGAKLRLLRAAPERVRGASSPNMFEPAGDVHAHKVAAERDLLRFEEEVPAENRDGVVIELGEPWEVICRVARAYEPDVVVIGAHRYGMFERVLGTTAARVVNHLDRQVLVVRPREAAKPATKSRPHVTKSEDAIPGVPKPQFAILEASALAGATSGVVLGAVAGPPGMIIGGAVGAAVGLMAGSTLDISDQRQSKHDRELDEEIGITSGDIGAREIAQAGFSAMQKAEESGDEIVSVSVRPTPEEIRQSTPPSAPTPSTAPVAPPIVLDGNAVQLREEHARLEGLYSALLYAYRNGDWSDVDALWGRFEPAIVAHMAFEEERVFPIFRRVAPTEAEALEREHAELRAMLGTLGMNIELHAVPASDAEELVRRLRAHGAREDRILHPWIDAELTPPKANKAPNEGPSASA